MAATTDRPDGSLAESIEENRENLEALAERDDLRSSKYARALLEVADKDPYER